MAFVKLPLQILNQFPGSLKNREPREIRQVFQSPTIIEMVGRQKQPIFISLFLHGNETTSFYILQKLEEYIVSTDLPRSLIIFVGNVYAAEQNQRFLPGQQDYNRIWSPGNTIEHGLAERVKDYVRKRAPLFASVDIHNNTGTNPLYACINKMESSFIYLASLFSRNLVFFQEPSSVQSVAFAEFGPSVTLECGRPGNKVGVDKAFQYLLDLMHLGSLDMARALNDVSIYQTVGRVVLKPQFAGQFCFGGGEKLLIFPEDFEKLNFSKLSQGEVFAHYNGVSPPFFVYDQEGQDVFDQFFRIVNNEIRLKQPVIPSMLTMDQEVILQDCLGYLMKSVGG